MFARYYYLPKLVLLAALLGSVQRACAEAEAVPDKLQIEGLSFKPRELNVAKPEDCHVEFRLNKAATVTLSISDWDGTVIAKRQTTAAPGNGEIVWDVKEDLKNLTDGPCLFSLEAATNAGEMARYAPGFDSGLMQLRFEHSHFDFQSKQFEYTVPHLAMTRVRLFRSDHLLVRTLKDWSPQLAGKHTLDWDGLDQSGSALFASDPGLACSVVGFSLPDNAFIVSGTGRHKPARSIEEQRKWRNNPAFASKFVLARIPREHNHDIPLDLEMLSADLTKRLPSPIAVAETSKVRVNANADDTCFLTDERFEVCIYIDGVMLFEEEDGVLPFTFDFNPVGINTGPHLLTVWLLSTGDHMGVVSLPITVEKSKTTPALKQEPAPAAKEK